MPSGRGASIVWNGLWRELRKALTIRFTTLPKDGMKSSTTYYQAWEYFLGVMLLSAYQELEQRVGYVTSAKGTKTAIVLDAINNLPQEFSIRELQERCPTVGIDLIRRLLRQERDAGRLECRGRGVEAQWRKQ